MKSVLHVGCGHSSVKAIYGFFDDWREVRFDLDPACRPDVLGDITEIPAELAGSFDAVYSSHNLEHVHTDDVPRALTGFRNVLRDGGFVMIRVPDLLVAAERIAQGKAAEPVYQSAMGPITPIDMLYGHRGLSKGSPLMHHKTGFTDQLLQAALLNAKFATICTARASSDVWALATKNQTVGNTNADMLRSIISTTKKS